MNSKNNLDYKKVVLGLSGGVDSTAAALLLKSKGLEVIGLYFNVHKQDKRIEEKSRKKAQDIADELGIKLHTVDVSDDFEECVINNFLLEYTKGRTPNPCIICNPNIKFKTLIDVANSENAHYIATGHYAKAMYSQKQNCHVICMGENEKKDQSYMLYRLPECYIMRLILPLGEVENKDVIRNFVRNHNLSNADAKDSQEICFITDEKSYTDYLKERGVDSKEGNFVDSTGRVLGTHKGIVHYTVGQRRGLGITIGKPAFVTGINSGANEIVIGENTDLFTDTIKISNCYFQSSNSKIFPEVFSKEVLRCKIRYKAASAFCRIREFTDDHIIIEFNQKQRAPAPGQSAVLYCDDEVIGGGFIE